MDKKTEKFLLWWMDPTTGKNMPAGVAFHDDKYGEFRLKIDALADTQYFLRPITTQDNQIYYRVEVVLKKEGKFYQRRSVGEGWKTPETNGDVFINIGPYSKFLILGLKSHEQK